MTKETLDYDGWLFQMEGHSFTSVGISATQEEMVEVMTESRFGQCHGNLAGGECRRTEGAGRVRQQLVGEGGWAPAGGEHWHQPAEGAGGRRPEPEDAHQQPRRPRAALRCRQPCHCQLSVGDLCVTLMWHVVLIFMVGNKYCLWNSPRWSVVMRHSNTTHNSQYCWRKKSKYSFCIQLGLRAKALP